MDFLFSPVHAGPHFLHFPSVSYALHCVTTVAAVSIGPAELFAVKADEAPIW